MAGRKKADKDKYTDRFEFTLTPEEGKNFRELCRQDGLSTFLWLRREIQYLPGVMNTNPPVAMKEEIKATGRHETKKVITPGSDDRWKRPVIINRDPSVPKCPRCKSNALVEVREEELFCVECSISFQEAS